MLYRESLSCPSRVLSRLLSKREMRIVCFRSIKIEHLREMFTDNVRVQLHVNEIK